MVPSGPMARWALAHHPRAEAPAEAATRVDGDHAALLQPDVRDPVGGLDGLRPPALSLRPTCVWLLASTAAPDLERHRSRRQEQGDGQQSIPLGHECLLTRAAVLAAVAPPWKPQAARTKYPGCTPAAPSSTSATTAITSLDGQLAAEKSCGTAV